jgi:predicted dehydrogenase
VLVVGLGAAGARHAENAAALGHEVAAVTSRTDTGLTAFADIAAAGAWSADAVVIANETSLHAETAAWAIEQGTAVLVEKPLARTAAEARALLDRGTGRVAVGYNLRFHPALAALRDALPRVGTLLGVRAEVGAYLPDWHPGEDYARSYAARADSGGGALLTLSHELDYVLWLAGPAAHVRGIAARTSELDVDANDTAEIVLLHESGALGSVHADFVDRAYNRRCRVVGSHGTLEWQWGGDVVLRRGDGDETVWRDEGYDLAASYRDELADFLEDGGRCATGADAVRVLDACDAVEVLA